MYLASVIILAHLYSIKSELTLDKETLDNSENMNIFLHNRHFFTSCQILLRVVLSDDINCYELKISVNRKSDENCAKKERCFVTEMEKTSNATVCLVRTSKYCNMSELG